MTVKEGMTEQERLEELISLYALGVLEGEELGEVEELITQGSPEALSLLRQYERVVSMMSYSSPPVEPEPALKSRLISELMGANGVKTVPKEASPSLLDRIKPLWLGLGGAVAAAVILILFISNLTLRGDLGGKTTMISELNERIASQEEELNSLRDKLANEEELNAELESELADLHDLASFLKDPGVVIVKLNDMSPDHNPVGRIHWDKDDDEALFVCLHLPQVPSGKTYQWWVIADDTPKSAGIFKVDSEGRSLIKIGDLSDFGEIQKFAVTLEPEGGVESPTGDMLLLGDSI